MITLTGAPMRYAGGALSECAPDPAGREKTMAYRILRAHDTSSDAGQMRIRFDGMTSHDITYVGIVQTARASGLTEFPMPYVFTNCHNSLCAVGGTINEDDHLFGLSAAKKYGGIYVPAHMAVLHQFMRERMAGGGKMLLGSDSHTRYGALGTLAVGEGGPELVKQLCGRTWDVAPPEVVAVVLTGEPQPGVGPQDVALAIIGAVYKNNFVKNKVMEFIGPGIANLSVEYRNGIDVMTTETACLSSIWRTDDAVREYLSIHGREEEYKQLAPEEGAVYDGVIAVELDKVRPMIALPFHPSNALTIEEFLKDPKAHLEAVEKDAEESMGVKADLLSKVRDGGFYVDQAVVAGCAGGTYENLRVIAEMMRGKSIGTGALAMSVYPASQPQFLQLVESGAAAELMRAGATLRSAFCGPCFGAGDVPANGGLSIRHTTRNFPNREGAKPSDGQFACVALMDARSIAATALNGGRLTPSTDLPPVQTTYPYTYDPAVYAARVYEGWGNPQPEEELVFGPNIADWPEQIALPDNLELTVASAIYDPVTTTDELIPSGETSSYRSNPLRLAEFALSRKDPAYVGRAKEALAKEQARRSDAPASTTGYGSLIFALRPGDGSAREQAASCQRVLGGCANIALEYATKRYRSNVVNWGMLPFVFKDADDVEAVRLQPGDVVSIPDVRKRLEAGETDFPAERIAGGPKVSFVLSLPGITAEERQIILDGCLINNYAQAGK